LIAGFADDERHACSDGPTMSGGEIVEYDDALAGIDQVVDHLAADITRTAGDQDRHGCNLGCD